MVEFVRYQTAARFDYSRLSAPAAAAWHRAHEQKSDSSRRHIVKSLWVRQCLSNCSQAFHCSSLLFSRISGFALCQLIIAQITDGSSSSLLWVLMLKEGIRLHHLV
jgi:hypothetical protein